MRVWLHQFLRASACLLALVLVFMLALPVPGHAAVATVQDAERMEDLDPDLNDGGSGGSLFLPDYNAVNQIPFATSRAGYTDINNTVTNRQNIYGTVVYNGSWVDTTSFLNSSGHFVKVADGSKVMDSIVLYLNSTVLPPSGTYRMRIGFSSDISYNTGAQFNGFTITMQKSTFNANVHNTSYDFSSSIHDDGAGGFWTNYVYVDTSNVTSMRIYFNLNKSAAAEAGGFFRFEFLPAASAPSDVPVASGGLKYNAEDTQQSIANSVSQIPGALYQTSGYIQQVNATLLEVINTISMQLNALWNQMFNYMHVPMLAQVKDSTQQIVDAINDIYIDFSEFNKEIISNDNRLHQEQLANDNQNTDTMVNGYDNSGMESSNSKLSQSMQEYESQESQLLGSVQGHIDDFAYVNPFVQFTAPLADVSFMLTGIYTGLGALNIPIAFSLTLSIGLICIGWYRFKGG